MLGNRIKTPAISQAAVQIAAPKNNTQNKAAAPKSQPNTTPTAPSPSPKNNGSSGSQ